MDEGAGWCLCHDYFLNLIASEPDISRVPLMIDINGKLSKRD
jgi:cobalamin-dependent methionine synthase I